MDSFPERYQQVMKNLIRYVLTRWGGFFIGTLTETNSLHLKMDDWKMNFPLRGPAYFQE